MIHCGECGSEGFADPRTDKIVWQRYAACQDGDLCEACGVYREPEMGLCAC